MNFASTYKNAFQKLFDDDKILKMKNHKIETKIKNPLKWR
jgi:hypothetical protein